MRFLSALTTEKSNKDGANLHAKNMKVSMLFSSYIGSSAENLFFSSSLKPSFTSSSFKFIHYKPPLPLHLNSVVFWQARVCGRC